MKAKPEWVQTSQEWLAYTIDPVADDSAQVNIRWEKISVPFTVKVPDVAGDHYDETESYRGRSQTR